MCLWGTGKNGSGTLGFGLWWKSCFSLFGLSHRDHKKFHPEINKSHHFSRGERGHNVRDCITGWARHVTGSTAQWPADSPAPNDRSEGSGTVSGSLGLPISSVKIWLMWLFFYDPDDWDRANWRTTFTTSQTLKSQNHFYLCPIGTSPEAQMFPEIRADLGRSSRPLVTRDEICDSAV